jgi:serine protease Do
MSEGIVSGLGRDPRTVIGEDGYTNFIQTDAAVNPGNSGGPLVNVAGRLVGMNVAIATAPGVSSQEGQSAGISFAIPLATIESVVDQLIAGGIVAKGYLGITHSGSDEANAAELNRRSFRGRGVIATGIAPGGPAFKAGLQPGDIILKLNERQVTGVPVLRSAITNNQPGDKISVEVWRNGETRAFMVTLGNLPPTAGEMRAAAEAASRYGIGDIAESQAGEVVVTQVRTPSPAFQAGLRPSHIIVQVEDSKVASMQEFFSALAEHGLHQGRQVSITIKTPEGETRAYTITTR